MTLFLFMNIPTSNTETIIDDYLANGVMTSKTLAFIAKSSQKIII
jgi:hypothetical protein